MSRILDEKFLLYQIRTIHDTSAFTELYDKYHASIYRFVFFKLGSREEAEDVSSDVFLKAWQYLIAGEEEVRQIKPFLYTIARRLVIDTYRERAKKKEIPVDEILELADVNSVTEQIDADAAVAQLMIKIKKLKQEYQEVIFLRFVDELSVSEIAKVLGKGQTNVRVLIHRAVKKLQEIL
jgi:RNA polymerase sigma-70 factor (ECF subfamily)